MDYPLGGVNKFEYTAKPRVLIPILMDYPLGALQNKESMFSQES